MAVIAPPKAAFGARLNETVTAGTGPGDDRERLSAFLKMCECSRGTALEAAVMVTAFAVEEVLLAPTPETIAFEAR